MLKKEGDLVRQCLVEVLATLSRQRKSEAKSCCPGTERDRALAQVARA